MILQKAHVWKKSDSKMLSVNQIAVFFYHQYLWKESSDILVFVSWNWSSSKGSIWKSSSLARYCQVCFSCNQIAWFFDHQYIGRKSIDVLAFLHIVSFKLPLLVECGQLSFLLNWIAGFFDQLFLWKEPFDILVLCMVLGINWRLHQRLLLLVGSGQLCASG